MTYKEALNLYKQAGRLSFGGARFSSDLTNMQAKRQKGTTAPTRRDPPVIPNIPEYKPEYTSRTVDKVLYPNESMLNHPFYAGKPKPRRPPKFKRTKVTRYQLPNGYWVETSAPSERINTEVYHGVIPHNPYGIYMSGASIPGYQGKFKDVPTKVVAKSRQRPGRISSGKAVATNKSYGFSPGTPNPTLEGTWFGDRLGIGNSTPWVTITGDSNPFEDVPDPRIALRKRIEEALRKAPLWSYMNKLYNNKFDPYFYNINTKGYL